MVGHRTLGLVAMMLATCALPTPSGAAWQPDGNPVTPATLYQNPIRAVPDGAGGAFVLCNGSSLRGNYSSLQRLGPDGQIAPGWPASGVEIMSGIGGGAGLAADGAGGVYVAWVATTGGYAIGTWTDSCLVLRLDAQGLPYPGWPSTGLTVARASSLGPGDDEEHVSVAGLAADSLGGCYVMWDHTFYWSKGCPCGYARELHLSRISPSASSVATQTLAFGCVGSPTAALVGDGAGGVVAVVSSPCQSDRQLVLWPLAGPFQPISLGVSTGQVASVVRDHASGIWLVGHPSPQDDELRVQRTSALGVPLPGWEGGVGLPIKQYWPNVQVVPDGAGGQIFVWNDTWHNMPPLGAIWALRVLPDGSSPPTWNTLGNRLTSNTTRYWTYAATADGTGGAYVAWIDMQDEATTGLDIYATRVLGDGTTDPAYPAGGRPICITSPSHEAVVAVPTEPGAAFVFWSDNRSGSWAVYAQRLPLDQATPALASLVRAEASAEGVHVAWRVGPEVASAVVQRSLEPGAWADLATLVPDGLGEIAFEDRGLPPGARVGYRLAFTDGGIAGEAWVTVPGAALALAGFSPNPSADGARLSFRLASGAPATIEVLDVSGRRVLARDLAGLGPGEHRLDLAAGPRLAPGVYVIRLTQGEATVTARGVVTR